MKVKETCIIACFVIALLGMRQTLEAKWGLEDVIEKGQILYELGGGSNSILNPESVTEDELPILLKNPKREISLWRLVSGRKLGRTDLSHRGYRGQTVVCQMESLHRTQPQCAGISLQGKGWRSFAQRPDLQFFI